MTFGEYAEQMAASCPPMVTVREQTAIDLILFLERFQWSPAQTVELAPIVDELQAGLRHDRLETQRFGIPVTAIGAAA